MFFFLGCGLAIQAPIAATFGLWFQFLFWDKSITWLKWVAWWSSNALGIVSFSIVSLFAVEQATKFFLKKSRIPLKIENRWIALEGTRTELFALWTTLIFLTSLIQFSLIPPWGLFIINILYLIWSFRFGVLHSSLAIAFGCIFRLYHANSKWEYMMPFSEILLMKPIPSTEDIHVVTVVSIQLFIIERSFVVNIASALFTDLYLKQRALVEASVSRERLMARMSHEIRTPLSGVLGLVEAWAIKERTEQRVHDLQLILNSAAQLKRVIDDVLDFSKISAGKMKIHPSLCNLHELFSEIVSLHHADAHRKELTLELSMTENTHRDIIIDSVRVRQIVNNLVANAIKFTPKGSVRVSVDVTQTANTGLSALHIRVDDTGIGISKSALRSLFQPFEQIGNETTRAYGGTGLGLAICRELTELLGGHISVESKRGEGSSFKVDLPFRTSLRTKKTHRQKLKPTTSIVGDGSEIKHEALVVEDDPVNQLVARRFLEAEGFKVKVVDNGEAALEELELHEKKYSLVIMDYFMPAMDGCEVTRRFRAYENSLPQKPHLTILGLTASVLEVDHQRCREAGMDDVLLKPIGRQALREALKKYTAA